MLSTTVQLHHFLKTAFLHITLFETPPAKCECSILLLPKRLKKCYRKFENQVTKKNLWPKIIFVALFKTWNGKG